jgi:hypothetical protein
MAKVDEWAKDGMGLSSPLSDTTLRSADITLTADEKVSLACAAASHIRRHVHEGAEPGTLEWREQVHALRDLLEVLGVLSTTYVE